MDLKSKFKKLENHINVVFGHEPWWVEFWSACAALSWAYVSFLSGDKIYYHSIFLELSLVADASFWQASAAIIGAAQLFFLIYNCYKCRWIMCFFASWFWACLTLAVIQAEPHPPSLSLYASYSCINLISMIKLARSHV